VVTQFRIEQSVREGVEQSLNQEVPALLTPPVFQWDPLLHAWWFAIDSRRLDARTSYRFRITLADGSSIPFRVMVR
jgi:hypothetical protein